MQNQMLSITAKQIRQSAFALLLGFSPNLWADTVSVQPGWNLLGNGYQIALNVIDPLSLGDSTKVTTVWKWIPSLNQWAFYTPSMDSTTLASYAVSKGYQLLTTINPGEGYWVNAKTAFTFTTNVPVAPALPAPILPTAAFQPNTGVSNSLPLGWSLIAVGDTPAPRSFTNGIATAPPANGSVAATSLISLWAWDSTQSNWYFYAPTKDNDGTLASYIASKNYLGFGGKTLNPMMGFWVNVP